MKKTNVPGSQSFGQKLLQFIRNNTVLFLFREGVFPLIRPCDK